MVQKITVKYPHPDFMVWLERIKEFGCSYDIVVERGEISRVYVREPDDGDWAGIEHGRIVGTKMLSFKQRVFFPRLLNGNFIADYNDKKTRRGGEKETGSC